MWHPSLGLSLLATVVGWFVKAPAKDRPDASTSFSHVVLKGEMPCGGELGDLAAAKAQGLPVTSMFADAIQLIG
jgi:hypothetical protein